MLVAVLLIAATGLTTAAWHAGRPQTDGSAEMRMMAPARLTGLHLSTVPAEVAVHYRFAAKHQMTYRHLPCYCGCATLLRHRNLLDCFVAADGSGWDPHAAGCVVCQDESAIVRRLLDRKLPDREIRSRVVEMYESPI
jgi:hypothetical protein